eukprot:RCo015244
MATEPRSEEPLAASTADASVGHTDAAGGKSRAGPAKTRSWAEEVSQITAAKRFVGVPDPAGVQRTRRRGRQWLDPDGAKPDPILQVPVAAEAQRRLLDTERDSLIRSINRGIERELGRNAVPYDVLNFQPKLGLPAEALVDPTVVGLEGGGRPAGGIRHLSPKPAVDYHILTLAKIDGVSTSPTRQTGLKVDAQRARPREFNIVSGDFYVNNAERRAERERKLRERLTAKFAATHSYHPVLGTYYDAEKEAKVVEQEKQALQDRRDNLHYGNVRQSVARSEGHAFDILTGEEWHSVKAKGFDDLAQRRVPAIAERRARIDRYCEDADALITHEQARALNRAASVGRARDLISHGHDVITNQPFCLSATLPSSTTGSSFGNPGDEPFKQPRRSAVPLSCLQVETVGARIAKATEKARLAAEASKAPPPEPTVPRSSFEKVLLLPKLRPAASPQFVPSSKMVISSATDYLSRASTT